RRKANVYPVKDVLNYRYCKLPLELASRTDYAANGGNVRTTEVGNGPIEKGEDGFRSITAPDEPDTALGDKKKDWNGIVFYKSEIAIRQITDGTSKTYMVGEKWLYYEFYDSGQDTGDGEPAFSGNNDDTIRVTHVDWPLSPDTTQTKLSASPTAAPLERRAF